MTVTWSLTSLGGDTPTGFRLRYKPTAVTGFGNDYSQEWQMVQGGASVRSITITRALINDAEYTFEVRSFTSTVQGSNATTDSATATYLHRTKGC